MVLASQSMDQVYSLRGLNMITPDQLMDGSTSTTGQSPYTINSRMFAPSTANDPRTAVQSRKGAGFYTQPVGEAVDALYTTTTGQTNQPLSNLTNFAQRFTPLTNNKVLDAVDILIKSNTSNDNVLVKIYQDSSGNLGTLLATSSLSRSSITSSYTYVKCYFPQAPILSTANNYWIVVSLPESTTTNSLHLSRNTTGANLMISNDGSTTFATTTGGINFNTYLATAGTITGNHRFVTKGGIKQTLFAFTTSTSTSIYQVTNESTGAITQIASGLSVTTRTRFRTVYDKTYIITGLDQMRIWDGTTMTVSVATFAIPDNMIIYHDRAWYYSRAEPTKLYFSNIYPDLQTVPSVNFQYVPDTSSPDPITGFVPFQDQLVIFTRDSKYLLLGDDVSTLGLSQSPGGTKGAVSQEVIASGEKVVYFFSIDGGAYYYDGAQDISLGDPIQPEQDNITDVQSMDSIVTEKEWRIYYKETGDLYHTHMLMLDLRFNEWFMDTEVYTRLPVAQYLEANTLVEASSTMGALYYGEAQNSHLGGPIKFKYWTNYKKYTSGIAKDRVRTFRAIFDSPDRTINVLVGKDADFDNSPGYQTVTLSASGVLYDGGETYGSATALYGQGARVSQPRISLSGRAMNTQYRFEKDVIGTLVKLYGYEGIIKSSRPR